jgi:hypothetical protein
MVIINLYEKIQTLKDTEDDIIKALTHFPDSRFIKCLVEGKFFHE